MTQQEIQTLKKNYSYTLHILNQHTEDIKKIANTQQQQQQTLKEINELQQKQQTLLTNLQNQQTNTLQHALNTQFQELTQTITNDTNQVKKKLNKQNTFIIFITVLILISISLNFYFWKYTHF